MKRNKKYYQRKTVQRWKYHLVALWVFILTLLVGIMIMANSIDTSYISPVPVYGVEVIEKPVVETVYKVPETIEEKIRATFPEDPDNAVAIFSCESGLRPDAFNGANSNGTWDAGIGQVNQIHGVSKTMLMDLEVNLAVSRVIYERSGNSWSPWVCARKLGIIN